MRIFLLMLGLAAVSGQGHAEIFKCVEEGGRVTYSNAQTKGCTRLNVGPINAVPAAKSGSAGNANSSVNRSAGSEGFPRVNTETQRARDDERRRILDQELASEQAALAAARKQLVEQESQVQPEERNVAGKGINAGKVEQRLQPVRDRVALHERNIEALRKEIGNIR